MKGKYLGGWAYLLPEIRFRDVRILRTRHRMCQDLTRLTCRRPCEIFTKETQVEM